MLHLRLYRRALFIDEFIDHYNRVRHRNYFPHVAATLMVHLLFPKTKVLGKGVVKTAHYIRTSGRGVVLKVGSAFYIALDMKTYMSLPRNVRHRYFAKIYWNTKYCILQQEGDPVATTVSERNALRRRVNSHLDGTPFKIVDIKASNICLVDGRVKIIDANLVRKTAHAPFRLKRRKRRRQMSMPQNG